MSAFVLLALTAGTLQQFRKFFFIQSYCQSAVVPLAASAFFFWIHPAHSPVFSTFGLSEPKCGGTVYGPCFRG